MCVRIFTVIQWHVSPFWLAADESNWQRECQPVLGAWPAAHPEADERLTARRQEEVHLAQVPAETLLQPALTGTQQENAQWGGVSQSDWITTPANTYRHTTRKCSMRWGFTVRLDYHSSQHAQAHNKKMLSEVGFYRSNQHTQAHNKKLLNDVGFHSQTGLLLQPARTGTQQENAQWGGVSQSDWVTTPTSTHRHTTRKCSMRWGFTVRLDYHSSQHAQAHNKKMLNEVGFYRSNQHTGTQQEIAQWCGVLQSDWVTTPTSMHRHTTRKCSMRWGFTVRLGYYSNQHAQAHNKKMLNEVGFHSQTGLLLQPACTGTQQENAQWGGVLPLQPAHTGTQQENAQWGGVSQSDWITTPANTHRHTTRKCSLRWGFTVRLDYYSSQHAQAHNKEMLS